MTIPVYQVDAFSSEVFHGNPAAVCPLEKWLPDDIMQKIAAENNLAETAFIVPEGEDFHIRWFTPGVEVALCGHATLAAAFVYFNLLGYTRPVIRFNSKSGWLEVTKENDGKLTLDFPADPPTAIADFPEAISEGLKIKPTKVFKGKFDFLVEVENEQTILNLQPDMRIIATLDARGIIATAKGDSVDFVSRCFFPQSGIDEDPVTGSAHCLLTSYWNKQAGKNEFKAIQLSARKGWLDCKLVGDRVLMTGSAVLFLKGEIYIN
jgi:PhzF family phenazine biosynthesis protein